MTDLLTARRLSFAYPGDGHLVIRDFELNVSQGEMVAIHGPSGCGKSTLLYLLGLFLTPSGGSVLFDGVDTAILGDRERSSLRGHAIGFVLQDATMLPGLSILENVAEGALFSGATRREALQAANDLLLTYGIASIADRRPTQVSGGQAQRAVVCRALIRRPRLVLADEPTGNLDDANAALVRSALRSASGTAAVVVVTHTRSMFELADRAIALQ